MHSYADRHLQIVTRSLKSSRDIDLAPCNSQPAYNAFRRRVRLEERLMRKYAFGAGFVVVTLAMTPLFVHFRAFGQEAKPTEPIFGTWVMDVNKSFSKRLDEQPTFATQHMRILAPEGDGFRNTLYNSPDKQAYSYTSK